MSSVILIDSSTGSPSYVLMLSVQAVRGLHRIKQALKLSPSVNCPGGEFLIKGGPLKPRSEQTKSTS